MVFCKLLATCLGQEVELREAVSVREQVSLPSAVTAGIEDSACRVRGHPCLEVGKPQTVGFERRLQSRRFVEVHVQGQCSEGERHVVIAVDETAGIREPRALYTGEASTETSF